MEILSSFPARGMPSARVESVLTIASEKMYRTKVKKVTTRRKRPSFENPIDFRTDGVPATNGAFFCGAAMPVMDTDPSKKLLIPLVAKNCLNLY
jgi:hypothetical protein